MEERTTGRRRSRVFIFYDYPAQISVSSEYSVYSLTFTCLSSGHRRDSFICADVDELVELRAHQRTYNGAYVRTALGILGYSLTVLRLFDRKFYRSTHDLVPLFSP